MLDFSLYLMALDTEIKRDKLQIIYDEYLPVMMYTAFGFVGKYQAQEDVVHNSILKIINYLDRINLSNKTATKSFVRIITKNCAIDWLRKEKKHLTISSEQVYGDFESPEPMPLEYIVSNDGYMHLVKCIHSLSPTIRDTCELKFICGFTNKEIAKILETTENNVGVRINRARNILAKMIKEGANEK